MREWILPLAIPTVVVLWVLWMGRMVREPIPYDDNPMR